MLTSCLFLPHGYYKKRMDILVINYKTVLSIIAATAMSANTFFMLLFFI